MLDSVNMAAASRCHIDAVNASFTAADVCSAARAVRETSKHLRFKARFYSTDKKKIDRTLLSTVTSVQDGAFRPIYDGFVIWPPPDRLASGGGSLRTVPNGSTDLFNPFYFPLVFNQSCRSDDSRLR